MSAGLPPAPAGRPDEAAYWNDDAGPRWVVLQERLDALFAALTDAALDHIAPPERARVLDIGCGCGATVLTLAERVGPAGHVHGVDISAPMLARARERAAGLAQVTLTLADAATHDFVPGEADLVFSRFGVMFFPDPVPAFRNVRRALAPGGRLAFLCWRRMTDSPWFMVPLMAACPHLPPLPAPDPDAPGPFAFADPGRLRRLLADAGFRSIDIVALDAMLALAGPGEAAPAAAAEFVVQIGPVARALAGGDAAQRAAALTAVQVALAAAAGPEGLALSGATWLVTASV